MSFYVSSQQARSMQIEHCFTCHKVRDIAFYPLTVQEPMIVSTSASMFAQAVSLQEFCTCGIRMVNCVEISENPVFAVGSKVLVKGISSVPNEAWGRLEVGEIVGILFNDNDEPVEYHVIFEDHTHCYSLANQLEASE